MPVSKHVHTLKFKPTRAELHAKSGSITDEQRATQAEWVLTRPQVVQDAAKKIDVFKPQRIKKGAPYVTTGPGTVGFVHGFSETPQGVLVTFVATELVFDDREMSPSMFEKTLGLDAPVQVRVGIEWLEEDEPPV